MWYKGRTLRENSEKKRTRETIRSDVLRPLSRAEELLQFCLFLIRKGEDGLFKRLHKAGSFRPAKNGLLPPPPPPLFEGREALF